jgi:hypothetical protein
MTTARPSGRTRTAITLAAAALTRAAEVRRRPPPQLRSVDPSHRR